MVDTGRATILNESEYTLKALLICLLLLPGLGFGASKSKPPEELYDRQCAMCHGKNGDGRGHAGGSLIPKPTDFTLTSLSREKIVTSIRSGVPGTSMAGYGRRFDDQTIDKLATYIQTKFMGVEPLALPVQLLPVQQSQGQTLYTKHCSACHGDNGNTAVWAKSGLNPPPRNFTSEASKAELSLERMISSITHGRPGTAMMPFNQRLSASEIESIVTFIRAEFMQVSSPLVAGAPAMQSDHPAASLPQVLALPSLQPPSPQSSQESPVKMTAVFPRNLVGDAAKGRQFYDANCYVCHGKLGDGNGPRAHFNRPRPKNFTATKSRQELNRPRLFDAISKGKTGTVMPAWATVLDEQQIANVAEYVFQAFIQPVKKK